MELLRVAILWHEMWHEGLEEASRYWFTENNLEGMLATLEPLHEKIEAVSQFCLYGARKLNSFRVLLLLEKSLSSRCLVVICSRLRNCVGDTVNIIKVKI